MSTATLIDRYAAGGPTLLYAIHGLSREQEIARPGPGEWSIVELVVHLLDTDLVFVDRLKRVIAEDDPKLLAFDYERWVMRLDAQGMPIDEAVHLFSANRQWMTRILRALPEEAFARVGMHSEKGRKTLAELLVMITNHVDHHLRFLYAKRGNLGVAIQPRYTAP